MLDIPYSDNTFDLIICNHVLEHVPNDMLGMKELNRVLKKGGYAILQVPISANSLKTFEDYTVTKPKNRKIVFIFKWRHERKSSVWGTSLHIIFFIL